MAVLVLVVLVPLLTPAVTGALHSSETQHRTKAASEKQHDLWCYRCDSMVDGDRCLNMTGNHTNMHTKCGKDQKKCQVRRISMSTSTEEVTGRPMLWMLQRNCSETCESGCIIIGERTKLHSCITCCDEHNFCNAGNGALNLRGRVETSLLLFVVWCVAASS
ncbi:uncharacterized protein LOC132700472 [Cylas formicarius]|uniref:uncharacterized protein LOC132700472 n=1 Tax=Cylas formicarius TaxID=197179 RepID=UPI0029585FEE|nr:uncharacterized protein LOC132700472 [Cylas formicarius]